ncbi:Putative RING-6 like protein [[Torrubiella] hemipterigena]|uniref:Putative RING-6 like protein n=1 Tax=[Torrubiella] hemipterigena TaxID=1531966 RepID=A0A0A1TR32_9HYPO|nr:Putative RING-6 like protein [[Torrubiella] hemipterigena]
MGKKNRGHPDIEEVLARPWCYYCERDFEDLKLLISHQKAKHFKCDRCGRRLNTAGGLSVHLNQVHKETLTQVENALPNRQGLEVEIFGMEGVPADALEQHRARLLQNYYAAQERRRVETGNPIGGQGGVRKRKEIVIESEDELLRRFEQWRDLKRRGELPPPTEVVQDAPGDDIDQLIRMAEAGVRPPVPAAVPISMPLHAAPVPVPVAPVDKKDKSGGKCLVYDDNKHSPEEWMAKLPRYRYTATA